MDASETPPLDREVAAAFAALPAGSRVRLSIGLQLEGIAALRDRARDGAPTDEQLRAGGTVEFDEHLVPGPAGAPDIPTIVLRPTPAPSGPLPCIFFIHGGGMVVAGHRAPFAPGSENRAWISELGAAVVAVDYRVAPEHPHPAPVEDCYAGLVWTAEHAAELGVDPDRLLIAGSSAGGGLAAAVALMSRDRGGPRLTHQILRHPMLDDRETTASSAFDGVLWDRTSNRTGWAALLGEHRGGPDVSPYAAPARATDLTGLPRTYLDTGTAEVMRDEIVDYAARLTRAGVPVELHVWAGAMHGSESLAPDAEVSRAATAARLSYVRRALTG